MVVTKSTRNGMIELEVQAVVAGYAAPVAVLSYFDSREGRRAVQHLLDALAVILDERSRPENVPSREVKRLGVAANQFAHEQPRLVGRDAVKLG